MRAIHQILIITLALAAVSMGQAARAQDDAYVTPSKAQEARREAAKRVAREEALERAAQAKRDSVRQAQMAARNEAEDRYNRRGTLRVTIEDMEENLDRMEPKQSGGGKYADRLRRFNGEEDGTIILEGVDKVYLMDDYRYDPWSRSYYGRGAGRDGDVYISINTDPWSRWGSWGYGWYPWYNDFYFHTGWHYPGWYPGYYDPFYRPWDWYGWGFTWSFGYPYPYPGYYGGGYVDGYYDGWYSGNFDRRYTPNARRASGYYDRRGANYGTLLGQGTLRHPSDGTRSVAYTRSTTSSRSGRGRTPVIGANRVEAYSSSGHINRTTNRWSTSTSRSSSTSRSTSTNTRSYTPSRSTGSGSTGRSTTTTTTTTRNNGTGGGRR